MNIVLGLIFLTASFIVLFLVADGVFYDKTGKVIAFLLFFGLLIASAAIVYQEPTTKDCESTYWRDNAGNVRYSVSCSGVITEYDETGFPICSIGESGIIFGCEEE